MVRSRAFLTVSMWDAWFSHAAAQEEKARA